MSTKVKAKRVAEKYGAELTVDSYMLTAQVWLPDDSGELWASSSAKCISVSHLAGHKMRDVYEELISDMEGGTITERGP